MCCRTIFLSNAGEDEPAGTIAAAAPAGLICGIVQAANPASSAIFKISVTLKTRNGILLNPHPRARRIVAGRAGYARADLPAPARAADRRVGGSAARFLLWPPVCRSGGARR
ncbi:MAG: hypothetical protein ACP5FH_03110 [Terracidiphilus sp.]